MHIYGRKYNNILIYNIFMCEYTCMSICNIYLQTYFFDNYLNQTRVY